MFEFCIDNFACVTWSGGTLYIPQTSPCFNICDFHIFACFDDGSERDTVMRNLTLGSQCLNVLKKNAVNPGSHNCRHASLRREQNRPQVRSAKITGVKRRINHLGWQKCSTVSDRSIVRIFVASEIHRKQYLACFFNVTYTAWKRWDTPSCCCSDQLDSKVIHSLPVDQCSRRTEGDVLLHGRGGIEPPPPGADPGFWSGGTQWNFDPKGGPDPKIWSK